MMLSECTESIDTLSAGAESIIVSVLPAQSMILTALFGHVISYYANSCGYKNKTNRQL
jgi:hypothetical protein